MTEFAWALVGPGAIARTFAEAIEGLAGSRLHKAYGRDATRTDAFIAVRPARPGTPLRSARDLSEILEDPLVEGVYVATPHAQHSEFVRRCLEAGSVTLVGAGPGDPGLLTLNAVRALQRADVILHDALVTGEILELARRDALRIAVGKRAGAHKTGQAQIHALMLDHARAGRRVVRLKGGDPFIFGRGGEELEFLREHGIAYDVVPGITAATACAAYAGIPLTHRDHAQSVRFMTAHCQGSLDSLDWAGLAREGQTLAMYMGKGQACTIQEQLVAHGRSTATPLAIIESGTRPDQRVLAGTLGELADLVARLIPGSPALIVIGEVARFAGTLGWFGELPVQSPFRSDAPART